MRRTIAILILLTTMITSCSRNDKESINKLILVGIGSMCTYDSLGTPQLSLRTYIEYNLTGEIRIAKGNRKYIRDKNAPPYSLDEFYQKETNDTLRQLIENVLKNENYDSLYVNRGDGIYYVLIYQTSEKDRQIVYNPDCLPEKLDSLHSYLLSLTNSKDLVITRSYSADKLFVEYEERFFKNHPPPPPPSEIDSLVVFTRPIVEDTITK